MLQRIARLAIAAPRRIIGFAVFVFIAAAVFGVPVADSLSPGGFQDPRSESARAIEVLTDKFGQSGQKMLSWLRQPRAPTAHLPARSGLTSSRCCGGRRWFTT
ncbi:transmembrane transport protein mmpL13a [Mycobacterium tuberculosis]|nr:transmembrane transport protein mmpL13a [Mycobacterium tuberculosis]